MASLFTALRFQRQKTCSLRTFEVCRGLHQSVQQANISLDGVKDLYVPKKRSSSYTSNHTPICKVLPGEVFLEPALASLDIRGIAKEKCFKNYEYEAQVVKFIADNILRGSCGLLKGLGWSKIDAVYEKMLVKGRPDSLIVLREKKGLIPLLPIEVKLHNKGKLDNRGVLGQVSSYIYETRMFFPGPSFGVVCTEREIRFLWSADSNEIATNPIEQLIHDLGPNQASYPVFTEKERSLHASKIYSIDDREAIIVFLSLLFKVLRYHTYHPVQSTFLKVGKRY